MSRIPARLWVVAMICWLAPLHAGSAKPPPPEAAGPDSTLEKPEAPGPVKICTQKERKKKLC